MEAHFAEGTPQATTTDPVLVAEPAASTPVWKTIFLGPGGLRAGWRLLIFIGILWAIFNGISQGLRLLHLSPARGAATGSELIPSRMIVFEAVSFLVFCVAALIMARIEGRKFGQYGLPWISGLGREVLVGAIWGFLTISGTLLAIFAFHGFRVTGLAIHGSTIVSSVLLWSVTFLLVGLFEEFSFRGYPQFTLTTGIGFWPTAILFSSLFGFGHRNNHGENIFGVLSVVLFGLLFCLILQRRGNLWWAVGFHAGFDWGQTFFYGVPDSGLLPYHNLLNSSFSGPSWLTGGSVGPEACVFMPFALLIVAVLFARRYPETRYRTSAVPPLPAVPA